LKSTEGISGELRAFARRGVEKAAKRYNPSAGRFQAYAWQDIYCETRRGAEAISQLRHELHQGPDEAAVSAEHEPQALRYQIAAALNSSPTDWWIERIEELDREMLGVLRSFLDALRTAS
jgi:DNA-directed RNA polymerase specialized sigma subunit